MSAGEPLVTVFSSATADEVFLAIAHLKEVGIPAFKVRSKALGVFGSRWNLVVHVQVPGSRAVEAQAALEGLPFVGGPEPSSQLSQPELRRGQRILATIAVVVVLCIVLVIVSGSDTPFASISRFIQRLFP